MCIRFTVVKQECTTVSTATLASTGSIQDTSPSYWTPGIATGQLVTCVVGHPAGSTASSSSSFVDDESASYEDITYNSYGPSAAIALQADYGSGGIYHHHLQHHQHYDQGSDSNYYDGAIGVADYNQQQHVLQGYDDKPPPYDNNNAADACDMNSPTIANSYNDNPYTVVTVAAQLDRRPPANVQQVSSGRQPLHQYFNNNSSVERPNDVIYRVIFILN